MSLIESWEARINKVNGCTPDDKIYNGPFVIGKNKKPFTLNEQYQYILKKCPDIKKVRKFFKESALILNEADEAQINEYTAFPEDVKPIQVPPVQRQYIPNQKPKRAPRKKK